MNKLTTKPVLQIMDPVYKDGKWYGALVVTINGRPIEIMARADEDLIKDVYGYAKALIQHVSVHGQLNPATFMAGEGNTAEGADVARDSQFGRLLSSVADSLPDPAAFTDNMSQTLATVALDAGQYDRDEAWQAIYDLSQDAANGDDTSYQWALSLRSMVESVARGGVIMSGASRGPSLAATLQSLR